MGTTARLSGGCRFGGAPIDEWVEAGEPRLPAGGSRPFLTGRYVGWPSPAWASQGGVDQRLDGRAWMVRRPAGARGGDAVQGDPDVDGHQVGVPAGRTNWISWCMPGVASRGRPDRPLVPVISADAGCGVVNCSRHPAGTIRCEQHRAERDCAVGGVVHQFGQGGPVGQPGRFRLDAAGRRAAR